MAPPSTLRLLVAAVSALALVDPVQAASIPRGGAPRKAASSCQKTKVAILGAGVSGIVAAQVLANASVSDFVIVDRNDYIGGRMRHTPFGTNPDTGEPFVVEVGANWIEGLGTTNTHLNPIWLLAQKYGLNSTYADYDALLTYDHNGPANYSAAIDAFGEAFAKASAAAGAILADNLQDASIRTGLRLAGWQPATTDMHAMAAEWWGWDFEAASSPDMSGLAYGFAGDNATFNFYSDASNLVWDQRGYNYILAREAATFLRLPGDPRLRLGTIVASIRYSARGVTVTLQDAATGADSGCIEADYAVCTFALGVLQNSSAVAFEPPLPLWKQEAIQHFNMGTYTKIFMQFNASFWPADAAEYMLYAHPSDRGAYPLFQALNAPGFVENSNILFATVTEQHAYRVERQTDDETKAEVMAVLRNMFPGVDVPDPVAFMYPRWSLDPTAFGSYSNWPVGMTLERHQNLRANVKRLFFAGEANSAEFFGFLHGAYQEGQDVGERIAAILTGATTEWKAQMMRYEVLQATTHASEYTDANGWGSPLDIQ